MFGLLVPSGIKMAMYGVLAAAIAGAFWHYTIVKGERNAALAAVGSLTVENAVQDETITTLQGAVGEWQEQAKRFQATLDQMATNQVEANKHSRELNDVLSKHDLTRLSVAKPGLIRNRINRGTAGVLGMFECATGGCDDDGG